MSYLFECPICNKKTKYETKKCRECFKEDVDFEKFKEDVFCAMVKLVFLNSDFHPFSDFPQLAGQNVVNSICELVEPLYKKLNKLRLKE